MSVDEIVKLNLAADLIAGNARSGVQGRGTSIGKRLRRLAGNGGGRRWFRARRWFWAIPLVALAGVSGHLRCRGDRRCSCGG